MINILGLAEVIKYLFSIIIFKILLLAIKTHFLH